MKIGVYTFTHYYQGPKHEFENVGYGYVGVIVLKDICSMSDTLLICVLGYSSSILQTQVECVLVSHVILYNIETWAKR